MLSKVTWIYKRWTRALKYTVERLPTCSNSNSPAHTCGKGSNYECNVEIEIKCRGKPHFRQMPNGDRTLPYRLSGLWIRVSSSSIPRKEQVCFMPRINHNMYTYFLPDTREVCQKTQKTLHNAKEVAAWTGTGPKTGGEEMRPDRRYW